MRGAAGICYGRLDLPPAAGWRSTLPALAERIARAAPAAVLSSPSGRCLLPARALARRLGLAVRIEPDLRELDFGDWEGLSWDAVPRPLLDRWAADPVGFAPPGGESGGSLIRRTSRVSDRIRSAGTGVLVLSHGGPLRLLRAMLRGQPPDLLAAPPPPGGLDVVALG